MIAIVDYGVGNLFSLKCSFAAVGAEAEVTGDEQKILNASRVVLPGVGAFRDARSKLAAAGLDGAMRALAQRGTPLLGICLGMQLLFDSSDEFGHWEGLGLIRGRVTAMADRLPPGLKVPQIGWNGLEITRPEHPLMRNTRDGDCVYFVHSYSAVDCGDAILARTEYGIPVTAAVAQGSVMGCQFHPEKSGSVGLDILRAFLTI